MATVGTAGMRTAGMRKVALRGLMAHKMRLVATFLAVALGVAFIGGVLTLTDTMNRSFDDLFATVFRGTDAVVRSEQAFDLAFDEGGGDQEERGRIDASIVDVVEDADGVAAAAGSVDGFARIVDQEGDPVGNPAFGPPTLGTNWVEVDDLNPFDIVEGRAPESAGEIVIDKASADTTDYQPGDTVPVQTRVGADEYELVGVARFATADSPGGASVVLWRTEEAQGLIGEPGRFDAVAAVADEGVSQRELVDAIETQLSDEGQTGLEVLTGDEITEETQSDIQQSLSFITVFFGVFAAIAVVVGSFVIYNSFSIIVAQRTREMALLRAVGASRRQVRRAILVEAVVVGLVGSVAGFVAGLGVASALGSFMNLPEGALAILPTSVATAIVSGVLVTVTSALIPARRASRVPPVAAMREVAIDVTGRSRLRLAIGLVVTVLGIAGVITGALGAEVRTVGIGVGLAFLGSLLLGPALARPVARALGAPLGRFRGITGALAGENARRNPRRTSATAQALMIGVGIASFFLVLNASIRGSIDQTLDETFRGDFVIDSGTFGVVGLPPGVAEEVRDLPEVAVASPLRGTPAKVETGEAPGGGPQTDDTLVTGTNAGMFELLDLRIVDGELNVADDGDLAPGTLVIEADTAEDENLGVGDRVTMTFPNFSEPRTFTVDSIYDPPDAGSGGIGGYVLGLQDFATVVPDPTDFQVFVQLAEGVSPEQAQPELQRVVDPFATAEVQSVEEFKDAIGGQLDIILNLILGLLAVAILIALLGIANTVALSVLERTRELGLLRAVGMSRRQVRSVVRWESVIISLFGTALGLAVGLLGGWGMVRALADEGFNVFQIPFRTLVVVTLIAGLAGMAAAVFPARRASRLNVLDAIQTE
jgi:putative ABC transport system permease protein